MKIQRFIQMNFLNIVDVYKRQEAVEEGGLKGASG